MPPVWLIAACVMAYMLRIPGLEFGLWAIWVGPVLVLAGMAITVLAALEFRRARTTIVPRQQPSALITSGIYRYSRNPIYLADVLILTGAILYWNAVLAIPLVALFVWVIRVRFIRQEERLLDERYATVFRKYKTATRRWI